MCTSGENEETKGSAEADTHIHTALLGRVVYIPSAMKRDAERTGEEDGDNRNWIWVKDNKQLSEEH